VTTKPMDCRECQAETPHDYLGVSHPIRETLGGAVSVREYWECRACGSEHWREQDPPVEDYDRTRDDEIFYAREPK
jgi:hypothetical protein